MDIKPKTIGVMSSPFIEHVKQEKLEKLERFRRLNKFAQKGQIVFAGSSLMEQFPVGELLMDLGVHLTIYNRGVGGFTTQDLNEALDTCIFDLAPKHLFINIGTNDLNDPEYTLSGLMGRYEDILCTVKEKLPQVNLYLLAYYPVNEVIGQQNPNTGNVFRYRTNTRIREANQAIEQLARRMGAAYLDLNEGITDANGNMKAKYTIEGIHMYADGYMEVLKHFLPVLQALE